MKHIKRNALLMFALGSVGSFLEAITYGSYTVPSRQSKPPSLLTGDLLAGFAVFYQGFQYTNSSVTATWDCYYPVGGSVSLNRGTLLLNEDFPLNTSASLTSTSASIPNGGTIIGNSYTLSLPDNVSQYSLIGTFTFQNTKLILNSPVFFDGTFTFSGNCTIEGQENVLSVTSATISIGSGSTLYINDATLQGITAGTISCADTAGKLILDNIVWIQYGNYSFDRGQLSILDSVLMKGPAIFTYKSGQATTIGTKSTWYFDTGMTFSYATTPGSLIQFTDSTSTLQFYETTLYSAVPGMIFTKGTLVLQGTCPLSSAATGTTDGVKLGDGVSSANNIMLKIGPESGFDVKSGYLVYRNV